MSEESGLQRMRLAQLMELEQALLDLRDELAKLPDELARRLEPVAEIGQAVDRALEIQRQTIDVLIRELGAESRQAMQRITDSASRIERAAGAIPEALERARRQAERLRLEMADMSRRWRPTWWKTAVVAAVAAVIGVVAASAGIAAFEKYLPPGGVQRKAAAWDALTSRVTPKEAEWLNQILRRPGR